MTAFIDALDAMPCSVKEADPLTEYLDALEPAAAVCQTGKLPECAGPLIAKIARTGYKDLPFGAHGRLTDDTRILWLHGLAEAQIAMIVGPCTGTTHAHDLVGKGGIGKTTYLRLAVPHAQYRRGVYGSGKWTSTGDTSAKG